MIKKYTVVLLRPDYLADDYGVDTYTAYVEAETIGQAVKKAQKDVFHSDENIANSQEDYRLCLMFEGYHAPVCYGWEPYEYKV